MYTFATTTTTIYIRSAYYDVMADNDEYVLQQQSIIGTTYFDSYYSFVGVIHRNECNGMKWRGRTEVNKARSFESASQYHDDIKRRV
jgi:hypothetical protein